MSDDSGRLLFAFTITESARTGQPWADQVWRPSDAPVAVVCETALAAFPGWRLSTADTGLVAGLTASGATERRHAHTMTHPLSDLPGLRRPDGVGIEQLTRATLADIAADLGAIYLAAYPPGHPDPADGDAAALAAQLRAIGRGDLLGPFMDVSQVAWAHGALAGACLVVDRTGRPPNAGPWVIDVFRDPGAPAGVGSALMAAALHAAAQALPALSLTVSHGNLRARGVYERLGFLDVLEEWTLVLPQP